MPVRPGDPRRRWEDTGEVIRRVPGAEGLSPQLDRETMPAVKVPNVMPEPEVPGTADDMRVYHPREFIRGKGAPLTGRDLLMWAMRRYR